MSPPPAGRTAAVALEGRCATATAAALPCAVTPLVTRLAACALTGRPLPYRRSGLTLRPLTGRRHGKAGIAYCCRYAGTWGERARQSATAAPAGPAGVQLRATAAGTAAATADCAPPAHAGPVGTTWPAVPLPMPLCARSASPASPNRASFSPSLVPSSLTTVTGCTPRAASPFAGAAAVAGAPSAAASLPVGPTTAPPAACCAPCSSGQQRRSRCRRSRSCPASCHNSC